VTDRLTYRQTDNADHYYSWPPHRGMPANNHLIGALTILRSIETYSVRAARSPSNSVDRAMMTQSKMAANMNDT